ncbi:related to Vam6/Vps39-like protein involved in vacuolar morphogenesis [Sporisorium reilianum f. sp. reilianum]|uniref:Related to Vam6/Vps39-like protein involved in vacuolar morphogenesis n=1 Tax=Sporisorium reilianum f. sp. reilianum TaxID=72559 RepID=A0A2N8UDU4_9BASI|nr:related to Vam6/Vps39-like protein involved in vacuolar morphogenesis [Sporisorium reilianum f. sp. reilianum]
MHTAFDSAPLLAGIKGKPEAIVVHGAKLYVGTSTGALNVFRTDQPASSNQETSSSTSPSKRPPSILGSPTKSASILSSRASIREPKVAPATPVQTAAQFSRRSIDQLGVIKEANLLVSLSDGYVSLHDLSTLELRSQLVQTRGATTFGVDTSIQKRVAPQIPDYGPGPLGARASSKYNPNASLSSRAFRPGAIGDQTQNGGGAGAAGTATVSRNRSSVFDIPSKDWQAASMRGMDAVARYREEERRKAMEGARFGGASADADGQGGVMTLVTVLAVGVKRKLLVFRWVDGEFWDTREVALHHTPRGLAFVTPTRLFMGYNATEYGTISIPLAAESTVSYTHPSSGLGGGAPLRRETHVHPPANSTAGPLVDLTSPNLSSWHVEDFDLSSNNAAAAEGLHASSGGAHPSTTVSIASGGAGTGFGAALGGLGGLGGYMGLSSKGKMSVLHVDGGEVLFVRDGTGIFLGADGRPTRREGVEWSASPLEVAFAKPYVFAVLPSGSVPSLKNSSMPNANNPVLQIRSVGTLFAVQTLCFPPASPGVKAPSASSSSPPQVRLLTPSSGNRPPVYVVVTPSDRATLDREGSTIWQLEMQGWGRQIDELVEKGEFEEALGLLDSVDNVILEDKDERRAHVQGLFAVSLFADERFDEAIEMFMELDTNPAKVIALYPSNVAGELSRSKDEWFPIFGGKTPAKLSAASSEAAGEASPTPSHATLATSATMAARSRLGGLLPARRPQSIVGEPAATSSLSSSPSLASSIKPKPSRTATNLTAASDADQHAETGSIRSVRTARDAPEMKATGSGASRDSRGGATESSSRKALDALGKFLADRRRIFKPMLESSSHHESKDHMAMSQIKRDTHWLLSLPNKPFGEMDKDELIAVAQTVDTALFKTFLLTKPALIGPLCRIENWCEVEQVEELLKERKKFSELIALYGGKEMHSKALGLLKQFADEEEDVEEKMRPTIQYLQNLGPEFIDVILEASHWLLEVDSELGMEVFTADTGKVGSWPRLRIVDDLNRFDKALCAVYLEFIIDNVGEADPELHDKLIRLYLGRAAHLREQLQSSTSGQDRHDDDGAANTASRPTTQTERDGLMQKLLRFLRSSTQYRPEQILVRLPADDDDRDMLEARALLLGRMGQHEGALSIYVRKLQDATRAEEYCRDVWRFRAASKATVTSSRDEQQQQRGQRSNHEQSLLVDHEQKQLADQEVFLTLLRIYLEPPSKAAPQLDAALGLIERHAARIDLRCALDLLPASVPLSQIAGFVNVNLRDLTRKQHEAKVIREMRTNRNWQVEETLCKLHARRVKVGESRTCPKCHKRLGNSVVAVNAVSGAVMHYFCSIHAEQKAQQRPS